MITKFRNTILIICVFIFIPSIGIGQNRYLKITLSEKMNDYVSFPPGTKFELRNNKNELVFSEKDSSYTYMINNQHELTVYPKWKRSTDVFHIVNGKIELVDTKELVLKRASKSEKSETKKFVYDRNKYTNGLSMKKTLKDSKVNLKSYNAIFEFSNGIVATYKDGEFSAELDGKELVVTNKYFIYSGFGLIKLSFDPSDGETWWVFEKNN